jgi:choline-sulfatase
VDARGDAENTLICFYSDHGDHLGDHRAWQKESFFDVACHIPFLLSWPAQISPGARSDALVSLADLFGIATSAAGKQDLREGHDLLGVLDNKAKPRERFIGYYGTPGTPRFKVMVREGDWKYIFMANGGREQLFNLKSDAAELQQRATDAPEILERIRRAAIAALSQPNANRALDKDGNLLSLPEDDRPMTRIYQFDQSRGVKGFPEKPEDVLKALQT